MPIRLTTSKEASLNAGIKALVYGESGTGKTTLCATAYAPIIISAEGGLLSIAEKEIPTIVVQSEAECNEALAFILSPAGANYHTVCLDSISEIAEKVLTQMKAENKDGRAAYGEMNDRMAKIIRSFRDMQGKHVLFTAKQEQHTDDVTKITKYYPSMPGNKLTVDLPYFFDEVMCLRIGQNKDGSPLHYMQTVGDMQVIAKDRSRKLPPTVALPNGEGDTYTQLIVRMMS